MLIVVCALPLGAGLFCFPRNFGPADGNANQNKAALVMDATLQIIRELTTLGDSLMWIVGPGDMVSENYSRGIQEPLVHGMYVTIRAHNWLFHLEPETVSGIQFVETYGDLRSYYLCFLDHHGETLLRAYLPRPLPGAGDSATPAENTRFEEMRARYANAEGVSSVRREVRSSHALETP